MGFGILDEVRYLLISQYYSWKAYLTYRMLFAASMLSNVVSFATQILSITVIYTVSTGIPGWNYLQLLFLSFLSSLTFTVLSYFNMYDLPRQLRRGRYDAFLSKPVSMELLFFSPPSGTGMPLGAVISAFLLVYVASLLGFSPMWLLMFLPLYLLGLIALLFVVTVIAVLAYLFIKSGNFINNVLNLLSSTSKYPLSIYGAFPQLLLSILLPVGIATYYPAELLLGRIGTPVYAGFLLFSIAIIVVSHYLIHKLMERYTGGGG